MVRGCYCGPLEQGEELLKYWRDWQSPIIDDFEAMPFSQVATISNDPLDPSPSEVSGVWLKDLSDETVDILMRYAMPRNGPPLFIFAEVRHAGGAISRVNSQSAAYGNRDAVLILEVLGAAITPEIQAGIRNHVSQLKSALTPHLHGGVYMNFLEGEDARKHTRQAFSPEAYTRLQELKARYDPQNRFNLSYDIPPAAK